MVLEKRSGVQSFDTLFTLPVLLYPYFPMSLYAFILLSFTWYLFDSFFSFLTTQHRGAGAVTIEGGRAGTGQHHLCARNLKYVLTFYLFVSASFSRTHALAHKLLFFYSVISFFTLFYTYFLSFCIVCGTLTLLGEDIGTTGQGGLENGKRFPPWFGPSGFCW